MDPQQHDTTGSTAASSDAAPALGTKTRVAHYRRDLFGPWWLGALVGVPLVLSLIGGAVDRPAPVPTPTVTPTAVVSATPTGTPLPSASTTPGSTKGVLLSLSQDGKTVTVGGTVPTEAAKSSVADAVKQAFGSAVTVKNNLSVKAGAPGVDAAAWAGVASALKGIPGVGFDVQGTVAHLSGAAPSEDAKKAALDAIAKAFPGAQVDTSNLAVGDPTALPQACEGTPAYVKLITAQTKIQFASGGSQVTADSQAALLKIAEAAKKCPDVKLQVAGNTDSTGRKSTNERISKQRAEAVKRILVAGGVAESQITAIGNGSAKPIATNATSDGRAANRRVDITAA